MNEKKSLIESSDGLRMEKRLFNVDELSRYLNVPLPTLYTWTHQRKIPHFKVGRSVRFDRVEIDMWLEARKISAAAISESRVPL